MPFFARTPRDYIFRTMRDFRSNHPDAPFVPVSYLTDQLKIEEKEFELILLQLHDAGMIELHPLWPLKREVWIKEQL